MRYKITVPKELCEELVCIIADLGIHRGLSSYSSERRVFMLLETDMETTVICLARLLAPAGITIKPDSITTTKSRDTLTPKKFDPSKREMTPSDAKRFEAQILKAAGVSGTRTRLTTLEEKCAPLDPTGLGVSSTRMAVHHLVEQGRLSFEGGIVTVLKKRKK